MANAIGFRFWGDHFAFVVLTGTLAAPKLVAKDMCKCPKGETRPECLAWVRREIAEILDKHVVAVGLYKALEGIARVDPERAQLEGVAIERAWSGNGLAIEPKRKAQIKKITGFSDQARYIHRILDQVGLGDLDTAAYQDAAVAALSGLPER